MKDALTKAEIDQLANLKLGDRIWSPEKVFQVVRQMQKAIKQLQAGFNLDLPFEKISHENPSSQAKS